MFWKIVYFYLINFEDAYGIITMFGMNLKDEISS